jgi:hypothetical protein
LRFQQNQELLHDAHRSYEVGLDFPADVIQAAFALMTPVL